MKTMVFACQLRSLYVELLQLLVDAFEAAGVERPAVLWADNVEAARTMLTNVQPGLLVIDACMPRDPLTPVDEREEEGLKLLERLSDQGFETPSVVLLPQLSAADMSRMRSRARKVQRCFYVTKNEDLAEEFINAVMDQLDVNARIKPPTVDIEIRIVAPPNQRRYTIKGLRDTSSNEGELVIRDIQLQEVCDDSTEAAEMTKRQKKLSRIADKLDREFRSAESDFWGDLCTAIEVAKRDQANTRVRFVVDRAYYSAMLEAIRYPRTKDYWMLQAPVYRTIDCRGEGAKPLFAGEVASWRQEINCLLIDGSVPATNVVVSDHMVELDELREVSEEIEKIAERLKNLRGKANVGKVEIVRPGAKQYKDVRRALDEAQDGWHLVHYGGHSYYDENTSKGFVFLQDDDEIKSIEVEEFSQWLRRTNLVFLGSCKSSERGFVYELTENQVAAVCGFRWAVPDGSANYFARRFYAHLFEDRNIEDAFWKTRRDAYERDSKDDFWAAPMLIQRV